MDVTPYLRLQDVWFSYGGAHVLEDVNLSLERPALTCIIGPNGGGKTTLLRLLLGLLTPSRGSIEVLGASPLQSRTRIGYVPQRAQLDPLFPITALEVVRMGRLGVARTGSASGRADRRSSQEALEKLGLATEADTVFGLLSGGQQQRVLLARALVTEPAMLLLDEPLAGVDAAAEESVIDLLQELAERIPILLVSHDLGFTLRTVRTVLCVNRRLWVHPTEAITPEAIRELYGHEVALVRHDRAV